jgi:UDP-N-acetylglucosamine 1-carboxyvinyltransferase
MDKIIVTGGNKLAGKVNISGAKNAALPIMAASILTPEALTLSNIPQLYDVKTMLNLLQSLGVFVHQHDLNRMALDASNIYNHTAAYELVKTMRASILVLGPLLARFGKAEVSLPGGCAIGSRPVDLHLKALEAMGASINVKNGYIYANVPSGKLVGKTILFDTVTVTGTENIMMAAALASGTTILKNAAREPEIVDLANLLNHMGAKISGAGTSIIEIEGVDTLHSATHCIMPDRIEAATFLAAAAITRGSIILENLEPEHILSLLTKFEEAGASIEVGHRTVSLDMQGKRPKAVDLVTAPYPGVATDVQAQFMGLDTVALGTASITETIFENRFMHVHELQRMGAQIRLSGNTAIITGIENLHGAPVMATDLRASAGLIIAALAATGETIIDRVYHLDRGYENLVEKLSQVGAAITRVRE